jgi:ABC-type Fe3+ transport system permease subunit
MPGPLRVFLWIFVMLSLFGLLVGTLNIMSPQAVHIPFGKNGESAEGLDGLLASLLSSMVLGVFFGAFAAFLAWLTGKGVKKGRESIHGKPEQKQTDG